MDRRHSQSLPQYDYDLPGELIAREPREKRDDSRLLVLDTKTGEMSFRVFAELPSFLPRHSLLVLNETSVLPARARLRRVLTGGKVEALFLVNEMVHDAVIVKAMLDRRVPAGESLAFPDGTEMTVRSNEGAVFFLDTSAAEGRVPELLRRFGTAPVPRYLGGQRLDRDALIERYQSVFARRGASAAAPTASLHFTPELLLGISAAGHDTVPLVLDIGLGTFAPVTDAQVRSGRLHEERFEIAEQSAKEIAGAKASGRPLVAVGTTVVRALESSARDLLAGKGVQGVTDIFIRPPHEFRLPDHLITNFHLPGSSLMALVDAFLQYKRSPVSILEAYEAAIREGMRFFSFGDSMLIR